MKTVFAVWWLLWVCAPPAAAQEAVSISVFSLFQPHRVELRAPPGKTIWLEACNRTISIEGSAALALEWAAQKLEVDGASLDQGCSSVSMRREGEFNLAVPGKIKRRFVGVLEARPGPKALELIVRMPVDTAVRAILASEAAADWPMEALAAQAVVSRSFLAAGSRHGGPAEGFDFCDTTHCQFLTEPNRAEGPIARAAATTRGWVLGDGRRQLQALYTRSCDGRTRTLSEVGLRSADYPYYSVRCEACAQSPRRWTRRHAANTARRLIESGGGETARIEFVRLHGWDTMPSNAYRVRQEGDHAVFEGAGEGHGVGLCQRGARELGEQGAEWRDILSHYFPNAAMMTLRAN